VKIGHIIDSTPPEKPTTGQSGGPRAAGNAPAAKNQSEQINISPLSAQISSIEADLKGSTAFDAKRVAEIKQTIEDGQYKINADAIADRMISGAVELKPKNG
jgi:negative regulator of flagellin synthesis FlgM